MDLATLARLGVATVYEASGKTGLLDAALIQVVRRARVAGPARTAECGQGDNLMVHAVMAEARPGDVLVLTMPEPASVALLGELLALQAAVRRVGGVLVDGAVRDLEQLEELGLPIWARSVCARGATKEKVGQLDVPVRVGGAEITPGDVVVLDCDGAAVVASERVAEILVHALAREAREEELRARLRAGGLSYDLLGLRQVVGSES